MRDFKFDIDIVLKNCERFEIPFNKGKKGVTLQGQEFNVREEVLKSLNELTCYDVLTSNFSEKMSHTQITNKGAENNGMYLKSDISLVAA